MNSLVIGAGLAGLAAADALIRAGVSVTLIEARDRLGGRVWTRHGAGGLGVDLGAEWIGTEGAVHDLIARGGTGLVEAHGRQLRRTDAGWADLDDLSEVIRQLVHRASRLPGPDRSLREALDACCGDAESSESRAHLIQYVEGFHAADPGRLSVRWLAEVEAHQPADASGLRTPAGAGRVVETLAAAIAGRCDLQLGGVVRDMRWRPGAVEAETAAGKTYRADSAVVAVPLALLDPDVEDIAAIRVTPRLDEKRAASRLVPMGQAVKLVLQFREPFWTDTAELQDLLFLHAYGQALPTWWTPADRRRPALTAWAGGPQADRLARVPEAELVDLAIGSLAHALGRPPRPIAALLESHEFHDWRADPFARGAYSYVGVGGMDAHRTLAEPVGETLYFAGEATCGQGLNATMEGAVRSGRRAASELLAGSAG